jgi:hypothetical protein
LNYEFIVEPVTLLAITVPTSRSEIVGIIGAMLRKRHDMIDGISFTSATL